MGMDLPRKSRGLTPEKIAAIARARIRCPNGHAAWYLYHKRIQGTTDTIICCRECEKNE